MFFLLKWKGKKLSCRCLLRLLPCADVVTDLMIAKEGMANCPEPRTSVTVMVHQGFQEQYLSLRKELRVMATEFMVKYDPKQLIITGHSLGGAIATLCALDFTLNPITGDPVKDRHEILGTIMKMPSEEEKDYLII